MLKVYLVQMESVPGDKPRNFAKAKALVSEAKPEKGSLVLFPEMFDTGYTPQLFDKFKSANPHAPQASTASFLQELANEFNCSMAGGGVWRTGAIFTNHVGVFAPGQTDEVAGYNKNHLFFPEQGKLTAGNEINLFKINDFNVATTICYDLRFPELYSEARKKGAELFTVQAAWPTARKNHWETLLKARSIENQAYVAAVNCVTADGIFTGDSQIISPTGDVLVCAQSKKECVVFAELDVKMVQQYRKDFPIFTKT